jgi:hypothetical protein
MQVSTRGKDRVLSSNLTGIALKVFLRGKELFLLLWHFPHTNENESLFILIEIALVVYWFIKNEIPTSKQAKSTQYSSNKVGPLSSLLCLFWQSLTEAHLRGHLNSILQPLPYHSPQRLLRFLAQCDYSISVSELIPLWAVQILSR